MNIPFLEVLDWVLAQGDVCVPCTRVYGKDSPLAKLCKERAVR